MNEKTKEVIHLVKDIFEVFCTQIKEIKQDISTLQQDITEMKQDISEIKQHLLQSNSIVFSDKKAEIKDDIKDSNESSSMDLKEQLKRLLYQTTE